MLFLADNRTRAVWRLSVAPSHGHAVAQEIARQLDVEYFFDWAGGLLWISVNPIVIDGGAAVLRTAIATHGGGHATLIRAPDAMRASAVVFEPLARTTGGAHLARQGELRPAPHPESQPHVRRHLSTHEVGGVGSPSTSV